jgi:hypothetical protein
MPRLTHGWRFVEGDEGDIWYRAANGEMVHLPIPADWATVDYVLGIVAGLPAWIETSDIVGGAGYAWLYLTGIDGSGNTVLITDENGEPIAAYTPVS